MITHMFHNALQANSNNRKRFNAFNLYVKKRIAKVLNMLIFTIFLINGATSFGNQNQSGILL
jgi:hypothetical protein